MEVLTFVKMLLESGADANKATDDGTTPLEMAVQNNHLDVFKILLEHGADANEATRDDVSTALFTAASSGYLSIW